MLQKCSDCKIEFPIEDFYFHDASKTKRVRRCKPCSYAYTKNWRTNNPDKSAAKNRLRLYRLSNEDFIKMYTFQNGKCAACGKGIPTYGRDISVDHSHSTGKVRGLLCHNCNDALGKLKDDPTLVYKLFLYILGGGTHSSN